MTWFLKWYLNALRFLKLSKPPEHFNCRCAPPIPLDELDEDEDDEIIW